MNIPGFAAENSLYKSRGSYTATLNSSKDRNISSINASMGYTQLAPPGGGGGDGVPDCAVAFGLCVLICWFVGESNCVERCYKEFCEPKPPIIIV